MITDQDLFIDIETFSEIDLKTAGLRKYIEDDSFEILLISFALGMGKIVCLDMTNLEDQNESAKLNLLFGYLCDPDIRKHAHNAMFERCALNKALDLEIPIDEWYCSMAKVAYCGLPLSLESSALALSHDVQKDKEGKALIQFFSIPCKPTKANGYRERNYPFDAPEKWEAYKRYNIQDVEAERANEILLQHIEIPESERLVYILDQEINDRGVLVDIELADACAIMDAEFKKNLKAEIEEETGISNARSTQAAIKYLESVGLELKSLLAADIEKILPTLEDGPAKEFLLNRKSLNKNSTKKYSSMGACACSDNRIRGLHQYYGANRSGRWAGRLVQTQNLKRNHIGDEMDNARDLARIGDLYTFESVYPNVTDTLSQLVRTAFIAPEGKTFAVADFSAIEARVTAWYANEQWRIDIFKDHGKIYEASAAMMYGIPIEKIGPKSEERQKGKTAELALGFGGSVDAMKRFGAEAFMKEKEMFATVHLWRKLSPNIVAFWGDVNDCAMMAIEKPGDAYWDDHCRVKFQVIDKWLTIELPSTRKLFYYKPELRKNRFNEWGITYLESGKGKEMFRDDTYGGKLTANIIQATARDLLANSMLNLNMYGYEMVMHIHDEVVNEVDIDNAEAELKSICDIMGQNPPWADGLPVRAAGYVTPYYKKDE